MAESTDKRVDDLARRVDSGFTGTDLQIAALRTEMREGFRDVQAEMHQGLKDVRTELKGDIGQLRSELKGDIGELRTLVFRFGIALIVGLVGLIAALAGAIATGMLS